MQPLLFGDPKSALYGAYHPALAKHPAPLGVVLCAPLGHEYLRTHRAMRQLAGMLAKAGHHALRFDYHGTGDSAGDSGTMRFADWVNDACDAMDELKDMAGIRATAFVGLRAGALIAAAAVAGRAAGTDRLICWDPIVRGQDYLNELQLLADAPWSSGDVIGAGGLALSRAMRADLAALDAAGFTPGPATEALVIGSDEQPQYGALAASWKAAGANAHAAIVPCAGNWDDMDRIGAQLLPQAILRAITDHLTAAGAVLHA